MSAPAHRVVAALDIGTNSVLLTVARTEGAGHLAVLAEEATVTRLGQDVDRTGELHPDAISRTLTCLRRYRELMDKHGVERALAVGTSAMRDARGGADFVELAHGALGFSPEVISGAREAELTFIGALSGLAHEGPAFVFDIGGGSTELIVGSCRSNGEVQIDQGTSLNIGSVRLTERVGVSDPPTPRELEEVRRQVRDALGGSGIRVAKGTRVIGVAGTVTSLAAIQAGMFTYDSRVIHGYECEHRLISELALRLGTMSLDERRKLPGLSPGRADVIVAGSILCDELLNFGGARSLLVSDRGVRFGLLLELSSRH